MILLPYILALSVASDGRRLPSCDAPQLGVKHGFRPGPIVVVDTIALATRPTLSVADSQAVQDARVDIGMRCAIEVIAGLGGLRAYELYATSEICALARTGSGSVGAPQRWSGFDRISVCTLYLTRDKATGELRHSSLWIVASGGTVADDGSKLIREYEVHLERAAGSRRWSVVDYSVGVRE